MKTRLLISLLLIPAALLVWSTSPKAAILNQRSALLTAAANGPFHVDGNRILDAQGHAYLIRGTSLPAFRLSQIGYNDRAGLDYGAHSATTLSAIRLRFNLNAVRLPLDLSESQDAAYFPELERVVRRANEMDLLVILEVRGADASRFATYFRAFRNVIFAADADQVAAIRAAGAAQPVLLPTGVSTNDGNAIYEAPLGYRDRNVEAHIGALAERVPVLANGFDPGIADAAQCASFPSDPTQAGETVASYLRYFDRKNISWTVSSFEPGKLIRDLSLHDATSLENGWTCGKVDAVPAGIGRVIQAYMRGSVERELFVVSGAGGMEIGRGAFALAYGPVMAERDSLAPGISAPRKLGGISLEITDAKGVTRPAGITWASEGWGQTNFVIPEESATGPARLTVKRDDGSTTSAAIRIADTAPGFVTGHSCRGPAIGVATEILADGRTFTQDISACRQGFDCQTLAIPVTEGATTRVRIRGSGFRHAARASDIEMRIGGVRVPVVSFGPTGYPGEDQVTIEIPSSVYGMGDTDLICHLNGRISNATRIRIGAVNPAS